MASNNQLLGHRVKEERAPSREQKEQSKVPAFLYHKTCIAGKILYTDEEFDMCIEEGWVESPADIDKVEEEIEEEVEEETEEDEE